MRPVQEGDGVFVGAFGLGSIFGGEGLHLRVHAAEEGGEEGRGVGVEVQV